MRLEQKIRQLLADEDLCAEAMVSEIGELVGEDDGRSWCRELETSPDVLADMICEAALRDFHPPYARSIAEAISEDVAKDILATTDRSAWNDADVRLSTARVLVRLCGGLL